MSSRDTAATVAAQLADRALEAASLYDDRERIDAELAVAEEIIRRRGLEGGPFADLASGPAPHHSSALAARFPAARVVGLELVPAYLALARRHATPPLDLVGGDLRKLPFRPGSLAFVGLFGNSFGYFDHAVNRRLLDALRRLLRPGGAVVITVPRYDHLCRFDADHPLLWSEEAETTAGRLAGEGSRIFDPVSCRSTGRYRLIDRSTGVVHEQDLAPSWVYPPGPRPGVGELHLEALGRDAGFPHLEVVALSEAATRNARGLMERMDCVVLA